MKISELLLFLVILLSPALQAIDSNMYFKHITTNEGLKSNNVVIAIQDDLGFIWFGTQEGLSRYDGHSFLHFTHSSTDSTTLSNDNITSLVKDAKGNLWIGTRSGLNYLDLSTYSISRMDSTFDNSIGILPINYLCLTSNNKLYISTTTEGLYALNLNTKKLRQYKNNPSDTTSLLDNNISGIIEDGRKNIWVGTNKGLDLLDTLNHNFIHYFSPSGGAIRCMGLDHDNQLVFSPINDNGLYTASTEGILYENNIIEPAKGDTKILLLNDSHRNKWMALRDIGLILMSHVSKESILLRYQKDNPNSLSSNTPNNIFEDKEGNIWISTYEEGVNFLDINRKPFILLNEETNSELENHRIRCIYQDVDGDIWIGSKIGGMLSNYNRETNSFKHYKNDTENTNSLGDDFVFCITDAKPGYLWVGTAHKGLRLFHKKTELFSAPQIKSGYNNALSSSSIYALQNDKHNNLWIGTGYNGLFIYNHQKSELTHYMHPSKTEGGISNSKIRTIYKDKSDNMWVGTVSGLNLYDSEQNKFSIFEHDRNNSQSISNNEITCMFEDSKNRFWVGTKKGLDLMDRSNNTFKRFSSINALSNNIISGILEDEQENLWISTSQGLYMFNPDSMSIKNYTKEDGLQGIEFANGVCYKTNNGELYFGGIKGLNIFKPEDIKDNNTKPQTLITQFKISNQEVKVGENTPLKKHITQTQEITLNHKQNSFTFEYVALNYSSSSNKYQYMMEGFDKDWVLVNNKKEATYTNMDPGNYVFRVKAANNDGIWNHEATSIKITILPPPWLTWWAYTLYGILVLLFIVALRNYLFNKIRKEKERELDQQKINFFINVSHEFRTPISLILNPIDKLRQNYDPDNSKHEIATIHQSAHKLTNLVNQLLDYRKMEIGKMPLKVSQFNVVAFTERITHFFIPLAKKKNIHLSFSCDLSEVNAWLDPDKYEKILNNLLSNAIKFSNIGGSVIVKIEIKTIAQSKQLWGFSIPQKTKIEVIELSVSDTGVGIQKDHQKIIFDRFYSSSDNNTGTGIGLNYTKGLVELHHGNINVNSDLGQGSTFIVQLPIGNKHFSQNQLNSSIINADSYMGNISGRESLQYELNTKDSDSVETKEVDATNQPLAKQLVYIVEDNKSLRKQIKEELKSTYKVVEAINGKEALDKIQKQLPDLIISDIMMPEMDGIELCQKLKTNADTCHIPILLLTAKTLIEHRIKGYETGADDYIAKPFNMYELKLRIKNILELRKTIKEKFISSDSLVKISKVAETNKDEAFLDQVVKLTLAHISNPDFTINVLQEQIGMSRSSFYHKISALTNMPPSQFLNSIRIKHAAELLLKNEFPIKEISYMCGFSSPSYFNKVFRKILNKTPLQYIKEHSEAI